MFSEADLTAHQDAALTHLLGDGSVKSLSNVFFAMAAVFFAMAAFVFLLGIAGPLPTLFVTLFVIALFPLTFALFLRRLLTPRGEAYLRHRIAFAAAKKAGGTPAWAVDSPAFPYVRPLLAASDLSDEGLAEVCRRASSYDGTLEDLIAEVRRSTFTIR